MFSWPSVRGAAAALALTQFGALAHGAPARYEGIGRAATPREVAAWDIDVRPDFKGLPQGSGSVAQGQVVWEAQCASCHGVFGESNQVFNPLVGGTTAEDVKTGRVARLTDPAFPGRSTLMKVSTVSTLWDYIRRAMPWNAPKSLSTDEVYAVTAYLLNLAGVLPDDFVLSDATMPAAQARMPNRLGLSTRHGLWPGKGMGNGGRPDVLAQACMSNCDAPRQIASSLPDFARNNHGNLAEQQRLVGPQRGADTASAGAATPAVAAKPSGRSSAASALALAQKHSCTACHGLDSPLVGPAFRAVADKYANRSDAEAYLAGKIRSGGQGIWGGIPMPPQSLPDNDGKLIAQWLAGGAKP